MIILNGWRKAGQEEILVAVNKVPVDKNTDNFLSLQGTRTRKLEARKLREQKEEEEKQAIDLEEAKYQAQKRKEAIEKAKTQQYYQTDRVKNFHVSKSLSTYIIMPLKLLKAPSPYQLS